MFPKAQYLDSGCADLRRLPSCKYETMLAVISSVLGLGFGVWGLGFSVLGFRV